MAPPADTSFGSTNLPTEALPWLWMISTRWASGLRCSFGIVALRVTVVGVVRAGPLTTSGAARAHVAGARVLAEFAEVATVGIVVAVVRRQRQASVRNWDHHPAYCLTARCAPAGTSARRRVSVRTMRPP